MVSVDTVTSLVAPEVLTRLVPVTVRTLVAASYAADVIVGAVTLLTVTPLPVRSAADPLAAMNPAAPAMLYVVAPTDADPLLFKMPSTLMASVALSTTVK